MKKVVNGEEVEMTPAEVAERLAEEAAWAARRIPTNDEIDQAALNAALIEDGSIMRAIVNLTFAEINILRTTAGLAPRTKAVFVAALKAQMRT